MGSMRCKRVVQHEAFIRVPAIVMSLAISERY